MNWREMLAGRELDRLIAEKLGWADIRPTQYFVEGYDFGEFVDDFEGKPRNSEYDRLVPKYSTEVEVALTLCEGVPLNLMSAPTKRWEDGSIWRVELPFSVGAALVAHADTLALAICRVWLISRETLA